MNILHSDQYEELCKNSKILEKDGHGVKLLLLNDGQFVKIFRRKRFLSSSLLKPYAIRFQTNSLLLHRLGISSVKVNRVYYCRSKGRHLVFYDPIPGINLRDFLAEKDENKKILQKFAFFLSTLHEKGLYFRSIHFGNVIVSPDQENLALIDIADLIFFPHPLKMRHRLRNFTHFLRYQEDRKKLVQFGVSRFVTLYSQKSHLSEIQLKDLQNFIKSRWLTEK